MGRPVQVHGHRGARAVIAENTLAGFAYAIIAGVDAIEFDVRLTRDEVPVVVHNPRLRDGHAIRKASFAELSRIAPEIPTLDQTLALARNGAFQFNIELKTFRGVSPERFACLVLSAVRRAGVERRCLIQSFDFRLLHAFESLAPEIPRSALFERPLGDFVSIAARAHTQLVSPHFRLVTSGKVRRARDAGIGVITWTVNRPRQWRRLIEAGVGAIITDDPAALIAWLEK